MRLCRFCCGGAFVLEHGADLLTQIRRVLVAMHTLAIVPTRPTERLRFIDCSAESSGIRYESTPIAMEAKRSKTWTKSFVLVSRRGWGTGASKLRRIISVRPRGPRHPRRTITVSKRLR